MGQSVWIHGHRAKRAWTSEYNSWRAMKQRCNNPNHERYKNYGGRGITYDERWESFECFLDDMDRAPAPGYQIGRLDADKNYCRENCEWQPGKVNSGGRRTGKRS